MNMSEGDVQKQIEHMIAFIQQEAKERVQEIEAKAEEEFNIEKGRLVQQERMRLMNVYEKKVKQITMLQKIHESRCLNQCRLSKLKCQQDIISNLLNIIREKLALVSKDKDKYKPILKKLILQASLQLMESDVELFCLQEDLDMVKSLLPEVSKEFTKFGGGSIKFKINETKFLPEHAYGGIELMSRHGEVRVSNTLASRLELISSQKIPDIRTILFGENPRRKFDN